MKIWVLGIVLCVHTLYGQVNVVPNPSFEDQQYCAPAVAGNFGNGVLLEWFNPNIGTPDYFNACWQASIMNYNPPHGQGFIGICTYSTDFLGGSNIREYASVLLNDTLLPNRYYYVSFYARVMNERSRFASNNLGVHFSDTMLHSDNGYVFYTPSGGNLNAQVKYFNNEVISDTSSWTWIRGLYQAHGGEKYLTLGNFNTDNQTTQGMEYMDGTTYQTYSLIDLVSVTSLDNTPGGLPADAGADTTIYLGDTAFIGQKISNMPSEWHKLDGTPVATNTAGVYVNPQETTTYVITQTINGLYSSDTVTVFVIDNLGESELTQSMLKLYPVPNNGSFQLQGKMNEGDQLFIMQLDGQVVLEETVSEACEVLALQTTVSSGTYVLVLKNKTGQVLYRNRLVVIR